MKLVARSYFWYPGLDKDLEDRAHGCVVCQPVKNSPPVAALVARTSLAENPCGLRRSLHEQNLSIGN